MLAADSVLLHETDPAPLHETDPAPLHETVSERKRRFERLVLPHFNAAYNLALWLTRNDHDAQDVVQQAVLHAYRGGPGLIYVNAAVASGELWILISDDGCGLKPRADKPGLGLGLGLISQVSDDFAVVSRRR